VAGVFDDERIKELSKYLPPHTKSSERFGEGVRSAAYAYAEDVCALSGDEVRAEIARLLEIVKRPLTKRTSDKKYEKVARALAQLSSQTKNFLTTRARDMSWIGQTTDPHVTVIGRDGEVLSRRGRHEFRIALPSPADLRDSLRRHQAYETIRTLCSYGARPSTIGNQALEHDLYAPRVRYDLRPDAEKSTIRRRRPKRKSELEFVGALRMVWLMATGARAGKTGNTSNPGRFVLFTAECLDSIGAYHKDHAEAGAVKLINEWERRSREVRSRTALKLKQIRAGRAKPIDKF
jgi:hypothetical protein